MKIKLLANEIQDGVIEFISLVKNGANRSPFKIVKADDLKPDWARLAPELAKLQKRLDESKSNSQETKEMKIKDVLGQPEPVQKDDTGVVREERVAQLRERLNSLNDQWLSLQEQVTNPLFDRLNDDLAFQIEKTELELASMDASDQGELLNRNSAFFFRGGTSNYSHAMSYDSANSHRAELRKAENAIDLRPTITTTDEEEDAKIDLSSLVL